jgi:hypothetical protein
MENTKENSEKIWKIWKKGKLNSEKIVKIWENFIITLFISIITFLTKVCHHLHHPLFFRIFHIISQFSSVFSRSFHYSTDFSSEVE